jgi:rubrerythrin
MEKYDSREDTLDHIGKVGTLMSRLTAELINRANHHDESKLEEPEKSIFDEYTPKLAKLTYGSDEYKEALKGMSVALEHHYKENRHHPEFWLEHKQRLCPVCGYVLSADLVKVNYCPLCGYVHRLNKIEPKFTLKGMTLVDLVEMICDWKAASMRHENGDIIKSIELNRERFGYSDEMKEILLNTVKEYFK